MTDTPSARQPDPLIAVKARIEKATPGPWCFPEKHQWMRQVFQQKSVDKTSGCPDHALFTVHLQHCKDHAYPWEDNARLVAHSPTDLAYLLSVVEKADELARAAEVVTEHRLNMGGEAGVIPVGWIPFDELKKARAAFRAARNGGG